MATPSASVCGDRNRRPANACSDPRARREEYCSQVCLVGERGAARRRAPPMRRRWLLRATAVAPWSSAHRSCGTGSGCRRRSRISFDPPGAPAAPRAASRAPYVRPAWPPTDEDWLTAFAHTAWTYPLPGPVAPRARRRRPHPDHPPSANRPGPVCRARASAASIWAASSGASTSTPRTTASSIASQHAGDGRAATSTSACRTSAAWSSPTTTIWRPSRAASCAAPPSRPATSSAWWATPAASTRAATSTSRSRCTPSSDLPEVYWDPTTAHGPLAPAAAAARHRRRLRPVGGRPHRCRRFTTAASAWDERAGRGGFELVAVGATERALHRLLGMEDGEIEQLAHARARPSGP